MLQPIKDLETFFEKSDPWNYEKDHEDLKRKEILLGEIPQKKYSEVLDIGCGHGFVTRDLPGKKILGVDISENAIKQANKYKSKRISFLQSSLFQLHKKVDKKFDLIFITGVLYPQYIGNSKNVVYTIVDQLLRENGLLITVHIDEWYSCRFPYLRIKERYYAYRDYQHKLEIYVK